MEDNLDEKIKPIKVENEFGFTQADGNAICLTDIISAIIKSEFESEPDSNYNGDHDGDNKSVTKVIEETFKEEPNCVTEEKTLTISMRNRMTQTKQDIGLGSSSKRVGPAKISYCEDSSSADPEDEYLPPKKKRTRISAKSKTSTETGGKSYSHGQEKTEIPSSVVVIKLEDSSSETKDPLSECSIDNAIIDTRIPVKRIKKKVVRKHSIDIGEMKEITFKEVCEIFQKYKFTDFYRHNPEVIAMCRNACKKYLVYRCKICMSDSDNMDCAKHHFDKKHSGDQKTSEDEDKCVEYFNELYKCDQCGFTTRTRYIRNLVKHVDSFHSPDKQVLHSCNKCKFTTFDKYRFSSHMDNHLRPEKQKTECHFCHASVVHIKVHLQNMHSENTGEIKCPECPSIFGNVRKMRRHLKDVHARQGNNLVCKDCGKVCKNGQAFGRHTRTHYRTGKLECKLCSSKLSSNASLHLHMRRHRGDVKSYTCADCEKSFSMKQYLQNHIIKEHDKTCDVPEKNHLCEICGKSFVIKAFLERHMVVHTKEKKFVCATCNKSFTTICSLKSHQVVHTGIKPFECGMCGNKYSQKYLLSQHIKKHHSN